MQNTQINPAKPLHHNLSSLPTIYTDQDQISGIKQANISGSGSYIREQTPKCILIFILSNLSVAGFGKVLK